MSLQVEVLPGAQVAQAALAALAGGVAALPAFAAYRLAPQRLLDGWVEAAGAPPQQARLAVAAHRGAAVGVAQAFYRARAYRQVGTLEGFVVAGVAEGLWWRPPCG